MALAQALGKTPRRGCLEDADADADADKLAGAPLSCRGSAFGVGQANVKGWGAEARPTSR